MSRCHLICGFSAFGFVLISACQPSQSKLTEDDISPIDYYKMQAFNVWLEAEKSKNAPKAFKAQPIQVSGKGRVRAVPDIAVITGVITTKSNKEDVAIDKAAVIINAVQKAVKSKTVELNFTDIGTHEKRNDACTAHNTKALYHHSSILGDNAYNANIKYRLEQGLDIKIKPREPKPRQSLQVCPVTHIEAKLGFTARVTPSSEAGNIINELTTAGVEKVDLLGYDFSNYNALYYEASTKAVKDAKLKAERIAKIAGTNLTEIVGFRVDRPQRIKRLGNQAMVITNHQNRHAAPQQSYGSADQIITTGQSTSGYSSPHGSFTVFNGTSDQVVHPTPTIVNRTGEILTSVRAQVSSITSGGFTNAPSYKAPLGGAPTTNALTMSLQAGQRTITVNANLEYLYETPIDGTIVPPTAN